MYKPARGGRSCEGFGGYKTINQISFLPLPLFSELFQGKKQVSFIHIGIDTYCKLCKLVHIFKKYEQIIQIYMTKNQLGLA